MLLPTSAMRASTMATSCVVWSYQRASVAIMAARSLGRTSRPIAASTSTTRLAWFSLARTTPWWGE